MKSLVWLLVAPCLWAQTNVVLRGHVPLNQFSLNPSSGNDIWGFTDPTGREYAIMGSRNGTAVFDLADPTNPVEVGSVPGSSSTWRDIKTFIYDNTPGSFSAYAFVTTEASVGLQVIDLSNVPTSISLATTYTGSGLSSAHNIYIDPSGPEPYAYLLGSNVSGADGVVVLDISDPVNPVQVGTWGDLYVHDFYLGRNWADPAFDGMDIGIGFCGSQNFSIIDFSDKTNPQTLDGYTYPDITYCHQGWVSEDGRYLFVSDELDEQGTSNNTTIIVFDLIDMTNPQHVFTWTGPTSAIDHNNFVKGTFLHLSNYTRGYTIIDISNPLAMTEYGFYDTYAPSDAATFNGAWGVYPYFDSGIVAVSDIESGLYILEPQIDPGFSLAANPTSVSACAGNDTAPMTIDTNSVLMYTDPITLTVDGLPAGVTASFTVNPVTPGSSTQLTLTVSAAVPAASYPLTLRGNAPGAPEKTAIFSLNVFDATDLAPGQLQPANGASCVGAIDVILSWQDLGPNRNYQVQIADNDQFIAPTVDQSVTVPTFTAPALITDATYYWRVRSDNPCGTGVFSAAQSFFTSRPAVLLVDDDDNSPDVRGYFEDALNALGISYQVFDVGGGTGNGPSLATMQNYQWLIWFSGDQYNSTSNPEAGPNATDEANLTTYLQGGGFLFLSSEDYLYDRGLNTFGTDVLGIGSFDSDGGDYGSVTG